MSKGEYAIRTIICKGCGATITGHLHPKQKYCSLECYRNSKRPQRKNGHIVSCTLCGKEFYLCATRLNSAKHYFCCIEHANEWQGRNKVIYTCEVCGKEFKWSPSRGKKNNIRYCSIECRNADPENSNRLRQMNIKQQTMHPNNLEKQAYALLDELGIIYEKQYLIADKFCVDAFVPSQGLVIQFDGDYWHGNPNKFQVLNDRQLHRIALDHSQDAYMSACGYRVLRLWESDIKHNPDYVAELINKALSLELVASC